MQSYHQFLCVCACVCGCSCGVITKAMMCQMWCEVNDFYFLPQWISFDQKSALWSLQLQNEGSLDTLFHSLGCSSTKRPLTCSHLSFFCKKRREKKLQQPRCSDVLEMNPLVCLLPLLTGVRINPSSKGTFSILYIVCFELLPRRQTHPWIRRFTRSWYMKCFETSVDVTSCIMSKRGYESKQSRQRAWEHFWLADHIGTDHIDW